MNKTDIVEYSDRINNPITNFLEKIFGFCGILYFLYILSPIRFWDRMTIPNQLEVIKGSFLFVNILLLLILIVRVFNDERHIKFTSVDLVIFLFSMHVLFKILTTPHVAMFETKIGLLITLLSYIFIRISNTKLYLYYFAISVIAGLFQIGYGIWVQADCFQTLGKGLSVISGEFLNTGSWGGFISILFIISLAFSLFLSQLQIIKYKYIFIAFSFIFIPFLIASNSRAAWLGAIASLVYLVLIQKKQILISLQVKYKLGIVLSMFILIPALLIGLYEYKANSADGRLLIWRVSVDMIKDKPLTGYGIDGFQRNYMEYQAKYFQKTPESSYGLLADNNRIAFNEFLKTWTEQGIIGLILLILLIYYALFKKVKRADTTVYCTFITARAVLFGLLTFGLFSYPFSLLQFQLLFVFSLAVISSVYPPIFRADFFPSSCIEQPLLLLKYCL